MNNEFSFKRCRKGIKIYWVGHTEREVKRIEKINLCMLTRFLVHDSEVL